MPVAFALSISPPDLMKGNWPIDIVQDAMNISSNYECGCVCVWEWVVLNELILRCQLLISNMNLACPRCQVEYLVQLKLISTSEIVHLISLYIKLVTFPVTRTRARTASDDKIV